MGERERILLLFHLQAVSRAKYLQPVATAETGERVFPCYAPCDAASSAKCEVTQPSRPPPAPSLVDTPLRVHACAGGLMRSRAPPLTLPRARMAVQYYESRAKIVRFFVPPSPKPSSSEISLEIHVVDCVNARCLTLTASVRELAFLWPFAVFSQQLPRPGGGGGRSKQKIVPIFADSRQLCRFYSRLSRPVIAQSQLAAVGQSVARGTETCFGLQGNE